MRRIFVASVGVAALLLAASAALATVRREPIKVRIASEPKAAEAGMPYTGSLEFSAAKDAEVSGLRFEGAGWVADFEEQISIMSLAAAAKRVVAFKATASDPAEPLILAYEVEGRTVRRPLDLSDKAVRLVTTGGGLSPLPAGVSLPEQSESTPMLRAEPRSENWVRQPKRSHRGDSFADDAGTVGAAQTIRVHGRIAYTRSDGVTIGADNILVEIWDLDDVWDDYLNGELTDAYGNFDINISTSDAGEGDPDLYVYVECLNSELQVQTSTWEINYSWESRTWSNFGGSDLNAGTLQPNEDGGAMHIFTDIIRDWRWYVNNEDYNLPPIDVQWPDGAKGAWYSPYWEEIHVGSDRTWKEDTHAHEYGHHFINNQAVWQDSDYENGICDAGIPGHCMWCPETDHDAWSEGWPNWIARVQTTSYAATYGIAAVNTRNMETVGTDATNCSGGLEDPTITEGFIGALMQDIWDSADEDDPVAPGTWRDRLALGTNEIFNVVDFDEPLDPLDFIAKFKARYPSYTERLWETAKNNTFEVDAANPGLVTNLDSPSHDIPASASPDATIEYTWTRATDDWSGVSGYSVLVNNSNSTVPDAVQDIGDVTGYTSPNLDPGDWWFHIRTRDRSGRWSGNAAHFGPIDIRERRPINLVFYDRPDWAGGALVARASDDALISYVPAPTTLPGNTSSTYWNVSGRNTGDDATSGTLETWAIVDGGFRWYSTWGGPVGANAVFYHLNEGPLTIAGGRHTFGAFVEATEGIHESDEVDNLRAHQWIWTPYVLTAGTQVARGLPEREGSWDMIVDGSPKWYNCDGLRFSTSGWWNAVWVYSADVEDDRDCRLHSPSTGATSGFASNLGWSSRAAGCLDAVLVNKNVAAAGNYDVGVLNFDAEYDPFSSSYKGKHVTSTSHAFNTSVAVTMPANEMLLLREFHASSGDTGWTSITVQVDAGGVPIHVLWLDDTFATGDLMDGDAETVTDALGYARLDFYLASSGYNCLVLYRDYKDGLGQVDMTVEIGPTKPDLAPVTAAGWYAPLVPSTAIGAPGPVIAPVSLSGNTNNTYWNWTFQNASPVICPAQTVRVYLDGVSSFTVNYGTTGRNATRNAFAGTARTVRGGRHTTVLGLDTGLGVVEMHEDNNAFGEQWVWSPLGLAPGSPITRAAPPDAMGGWLDIDSEAPRYFNCDGLRTPVFAAAGDDGYWAAVAVMPGAAGDVDVRLHEVDTGVKDGFGANLASSGWGPGESDFVLASFRETSFRAFDAGVVLESGAEDYFAEVATSTYRGNNPAGVQGPFTLGANRVVDLHEFYLAAGTWEVRLENVSGTVDWGMSVHGDGAAYFGKSSSLVDGASWSNGAGMVEHMRATVPAEGYYCLAVWKAGAGDLAVAGEYQLRMFRMTVDVPQVASASVTRLAAPRPNPFSNRTALHFELAREEDVALEIFDVRGARVRTLASGRWPAGAHAVAWDGRWDGGLRAAPGVYVARLAAGRYHAERKLVVIE